MTNGLVLRSALLVSASFASLSAAHAQNAVSAGGEPEATPHIVTNHEVPTGPANVLPGTVGPNNGSIYSNSPDVLDPAGSINGIGQQIAFIQTGATTAGLSLCTGSLINPRTVLTAAHCVYNNPAHFYGSRTGTGGGVSGNFGTGGAPLSSAGIPLSFGFESLNRNCFNASGLPAPCPAGQKGPYEAWRDANFSTVAARHIYNANQVWYGTGAQPVALGGLGEFGNQDIALVTLDTHADGIPTWTLLFSPLDGPTHATITGYGGAGVGLSGIGNLAGIDYRRRSAENMIDALISSRDWGTSAAIGGGLPQFGALNHVNYWTDFDDPDHDPENLPANFFVNVQPGPNPPRNNGYYDFNGLGGRALEREGSTAGGDSGGPLIADQRWDKDVIVGVLTGSWSFNGGIATYGQFNVYPPLFQFWQDIIRNNPYVYASALAGNGDWFDPGHWVQDMDPNYAIIGANGELLTGVPDTAQGGADGAVDRFGTVCFLETDCTTFDGPTTPSGNGTAVFTPGGPGSLNFVPNNREPVNSATPALNVKARYYDVTLREAGNTTLSQSATIDRLTLNGAAKLTVASAGNLTVLGDFTQGSGWTQVDGRLKTGEALVVKGLLSGTGTFDPTFLTVVAGVVAPGGGDKIGTLTVQGDVILASASALFVDVFRGSADKLVVTADAPSTGILTLSNASVVFNKVTDKAAPRDGEKYTIASAAGGVSGKFGTIYSFQGVLRPELSYSANDVVATLRAGSLAVQLGQSTANAQAFALALDTLRSSSYTNLYNLYGAVDLMAPGELGYTLEGLVPRTLNESGSLQDVQSRMLMSNVSDRLALVGTGAATGMTVVGDARGFARDLSGTAATRQMLSGLAPSGQLASALPEGVSGFVAAGTMSGKSSYGSSARLGGGRTGNWMGMGLEFRAGDRTTVGTATGFASATSRPGSDRVNSRTFQAAAYATRELGDGAYLGMVGSLEMAHVEQDRSGFDGTNPLALTGASDSRRIGLMAEAGKSFALGGGMSLTPRVRLAYDRHALAGFREHGGETALAIDSLVRERLEAKLGFAVSGSAGIGNGWRVVPQVQADVARRISGNGDRVSVRFAGAPDAAIALTLAGTSRTWAEGRAALSIDNGTVAFSAGAETAIGAAYRDDRALAGFTVRF